MARPRPVFLHGLWRSGTTYVWSRFREAPGTYCYYEPLNPGMRRLRQARLDRDTPELMARRGHPVLARPYFAEYAPLLTRRGIRGYRPAFAHDRFALTPGEGHDALARYVASLVDHGASQGKVPVLGFNRTGLRVAWLRQRFASCDIHIDRDPLGVWASYRRHMADGNYSFFTFWLTIAERNAAHPVFAPLAARLPRPGLLERLRLASPKRSYAAALDRMGDEETYLMVVYVWAACALHALGHCDVVIDMGRAGEPGYATDRADAVRAASGLDVRFDELRATSAAEAEALIPREAREAVEREALALLPRDALGPFLDAARARARLAELAPRKAALLASLLEDFPGPA